MFKVLRQRFFGNRNGESKNVARSRLHFVLVQDRSGLSNDEMAKFKEEMCRVIDKYFEIDKAGFDISYKREAETTTLLINSPVVVRRGEAAVAEKSKKVKKVVSTKEPESSEKKDLEVPAAASS